MTTIFIDVNMEQQIHNNGIDKRIIFRVKDNGAGIEPEIFPRLFTKFAPKSESEALDWVCLFQKHYRISWWLNMGQE